MDLYYLLYLVGEKLSIGNTITLNSINVELLSKIFVHTLDNKYCCKILTRQHMNIIVYL